MRLLIILSLLVGSCFAQKVGGLYSRESDGSFTYHCTFFPIKHEAHHYVALTAGHCVADADEDQVYVSFDDEESPQFYKVALGDAGNDYAYLEFESRLDYNVFELGDSDELKVGDTVETLAETYGLGAQRYHGFVSKLHCTRPMETDKGSLKDPLLLQLPSAPGASGAPLLHAGKVVGIMVAVRGVIAFATPINRVK